ncbi:hypothetical protein [Microvirga zambiensis]|uniref:hypothetical protein n=1 Tax=Microvirga zambiensis TaxID=1402137 RepID=UPI00191DD648|nr:hypothetical protein [Microvirga zambiensis]
MNIDERILRLGELIGAMPIQKSPTRLAFEANYEKIEGALANGNKYESICSFFEQLEFVIAPSTLRQYVREERAKRKKAADAKVTEETSAPKGDEKSKRKRKDNADAAPKVDKRPHTDAEETPAVGTPPVQRLLPAARPQPGKIQRSF